MYLSGMRKMFNLCLFMGISCCLLAQTDTTSGSKAAGAIEKILNEVKAYKIDTSDVPDDKITRKIIQLRKLRGGFNVNEVISYKMQEEERNKETPISTMTALKEQFQSGKAKQWLDNAVIWVYRQQFTYKELKQMVRFYKTSAGQKYATYFPAVMLKTLMAAQTIHDKIVADLKK
jgi:hypothetical protein